MPGDTVEVERPRPTTARLARTGSTSSGSERWGSAGRRSLDCASARPTPGRARSRACAARRRTALTVTLPEPEAGLAAGILIGLRDRVDRDVAAAFTTAGVSHVVAISGWNIAIVAAASRPWPGASGVADGRS